jgi:predicted transcriptional regulator
MKIKELMTKRVYSVNHNQNLSDAAQLMWEHDCGWLPVLGKDGKLLATITDRDIAMATFLNGKSLADIPLSEAHSKAVFTCEQNDEVTTAETIMQSNQVRRLPVVNKKAKLVGIVSLNDIALAYQSDNKVVDAIALGKTLAAICKHKHTANQITAAA